MRLLSSPLLPTVAGLNTYILEAHLLLNVLRCNVDGDHEAACPFELECPVAHSVSLDFIRHQNESIIAGRAIILEILDDYWLIGHTESFVERQFGDFSTIQASFSTVTCGCPFHSGIFGHRE